MNEAFNADLWFSSLAPSDAERLLAAADERSLSRGQMLWWGGDVLPRKGASFYGLIEGRLRPSAHTADGQETLLRFLTPGSWFGELSIIDELPRDYSMRAETDVRLLEVPRDRFVLLLQEASFAHAIIRLMGQRLRTFYVAFGHAVSSPPLTRVAYQLLLIAHRGMIWKPQQPLETVQISQESLCQMTGLSKPTVLRALKTLEQTGTISQHYGEIGIQDMAALHERALSTET